MTNNSIYENDPSESLIYLPPKSASFGHKIRYGNPGRTWENVRLFLEAHTIYRIRNDSIVLTYITDEYSSKGTHFSKTEFRIRELFGSESETETSIRKWNLTPEQLPMAMELAFENNEWCLESNWFPRLRFAVDFIWAEFSSGSLGEQTLFVGSRYDLTRPSWMIVNIYEKHILLQPYFYFPFSIHEIRARQFLAKLEKSLPFQFRDGYFRRVIKTIKGTSYRYAKLTVSWRN